MKKTYEKRDLVISENEKQKKFAKKKYFIGTTAYHQIADISRSKPDLFLAVGETKNYYIGNWVTGLGFVGVLFPKETSRGLTDEEIEAYNKKTLQLASYPLYKLEITKEDTT